jgi:hypothetical protein
MDSDKACNSTMADINMITLRLEVRKRYLNENRNPPRWVEVDIMNADRTLNGKIEELLDNEEEINGKYESITEAIMDKIENEHVCGKHLIKIMEKLKMMKSENNNFKLRLVDTVLNELLKKGEHEFFEATGLKPEVENYKAFENYCKYKEEHKIKTLNQIRERRESIERLKNSYEKFLEEVKKVKKIDATNDKHYALPSRRQLHRTIPLKKFTELKVRIRKSHSNYEHKKKNYKTSAASAQSHEQMDKKKKPEVGKYMGYFVRPSAAD